MKRIRKISLIIHILVGVGALFGGLLAMLYPESPMGIDSDSLPNMPFASFFIPGLILFVVMGLGNLTGAVLQWKRSALAAYATGIVGGALVIWIMVQCYMLSTIVALHMIFFLIGAVQCLLALLQLYDQNMFPLRFLRKASTARQNLDEHEALPK